jgi:hypothetical protein
MCLEDYQMLALDRETEKLFLYENAEGVFENRFGQLRIIHGEATD